MTIIINTLCDLTKLKKVSDINVKPVSHFTLKISFNHQINKHEGQPANFKMSVLKSYSDSLSRQAGEGVYISKMQGEILNGRSEFYQPSIVSIRREVTRGL